MAKVSVIIPVYNCQRYLQRCVDSILTQTERDFQLVLVDDGSTDRSGQMCDALAKQDGRILVIHQKNAGVSAARNAGLDAATGRYVNFVDADDWLEPDTLEQVWSAAVEADADVVIFDPFVHEPDKGAVTVDSLPFYPTSAALRKEDLIPERLRFVAGAVWRILVRRSLIEDNALRFSVRLPLSEDRIFNMMVLGCSRNIYYLRKPLYHYWVNAGSAVNKYRPNMLQIVLETQKATESVLIQYWDESYIPIYEKVNVADGSLLCVYMILSKENKQSFIERYKAVKALVSNERICRAMGRLEKKSLRQWLVWKKCSLLLCLFGYLWNLKNRS